jgi:hypothetical protein
VLKCASVNKSVRAKEMLGKKTDLVKRVPLHFDRNSIFHIFSELISKLFIGRVNFLETV